MADEDGWSALRAGVVAMSMEVVGVVALAVTSIFRVAVAVGVVGLMSMGVGGLIGLLGLFANDGSAARRRLGRLLCVVAIAVVAALVIVFAATAPDPS